MSHLMLGVARRPITPPIGGYLYGYPNPPRSTEVHDDLTVTALYVADENTRALLLSFTICSLSTPLCERLSAVIGDATKIAHHAVFCHATHTHSGPSTTDSAGWGEADTDYIESILIPAALAAAREAVAASVPARMAVATGESYVGINRRRITPEGRATLGQQKDGPHDPTMTVLGFFGEDGTPLATAVHYAAHCTASGKNTEITRDWAGVMLDALEERTGAPALFLQGPEGDIGPRMPSGKTIGDNGVSDALVIGSIAARDALGIYETLDTPKAVAVRVSHSVLKLPLAARPSPAEAEEAIRQNTDATAGVEAKTLHYYNRVLASYREDYQEKAYTPLPQALLLLGEVALVAFPYELFSEIGMNIKAASPFAHTLPLALTNGRGCYFVTEKAIPYGGYEVDMFLLEGIQHYASGIDRTLAELTLKHLSDCKQNLC